MQTFLAYPDRTKSAQCLDVKRLGKQRVEAWQILRTLTGETLGWRHHPAVKMWAGCEMYLSWYGLAICDEWIGRGYKDTLRERFLMSIGRNIKKPEWFGDERLHSSHRAALLFKLPTWYEKFGWIEEPQIAYYWPVR